MKNNYSATMKHEYQWQ